MSNENTRRAELLYETGKLIVANTIQEVGICNAQMALVVATSLVLGMHAGHHGKEPEVDIADALTTIKKGALMLYEEKSTKGLAE